MFEENDDYPSLIEGHKETYQENSTYKIEFLKGPNNVYHMDFFIYSYPFTLSIKIQQLLMRTYLHRHKLGISDKYYFKFAITIFCPSQTQSQIENAAQLTRDTLAPLCHKIVLLVDGHMLNLFNYP
jgi:hypothetical protein